MENLVVVLYWINGTFVVERLEVRQFVLAIIGSPNVSMFGRRTVVSMVRVLLSRLHGR